MLAGTGIMIRTPDQRVRVFVSSTLEELAAERQAAAAAIRTVRPRPLTVRRLRHLRLAGSLLRLVTGLPLLKRPHVAVGVTEI